jgi:hypothetical protein
MPDFSEAKKHESSAILIRKLLAGNTVAADRKQVAGVENSTSR